jgi:hypothetical protein
MKPTLTLSGTSSGKPKQEPVDRGQSSTPQPERRKYPRIPFTATALVVEPESGARFDAHTSDLSPGGCYVDTMSPLPTGTEVELQLVKDGKMFQTQARVAHYTMGVGMGLLFTSIEPEDVSLLEEWFGEMKGGSGPSGRELEANTKTETAKNSDDRERYALEELLVLMMQKGLLSEDEGQTILKKLLR